MAVGDGGLRGLCFSLAKFLSMAVSLTAISGSQATACVLPSPPSCESTESEAVCLERAQKWYADQEASRIEYEKKTPEERALIEQTRLWDSTEIIFLARVEKIKLRGKVYLQPEPKLPKRPAGKMPIPPPRVPMPAFPKYGETYEAYLRPIQWIKGPKDFVASWQSVGGMTSCGSSNDGDLAYSYPGDQIVIFSDWATYSQLVRGKWASTKYLSLYGLNREELVEPRILAALTESSIRGNGQPK